MSLTLPQCPLCGQPNGCPYSSGDAYKGPCWCERETFSPALLAQVPPEAVRGACICRRCAVRARLRAACATTPPPTRAGDFYLEGRTYVFTAQYLRRRGYCCGNNCRHCPFDALEQEISREERALIKVGGGRSA